MHLDRDPRWLRLHDREWICPCCGVKHAGLFDLACARPDLWPGSKKARPNWDVLRARKSFSDNILTEDFCILDGEHFFVRCLLRLPIVGEEDFFGFGVWSTLSRLDRNLLDADEGNLRKRPHKRAYQDPGQDRPPAANQGRKISARCVQGKLNKPQAR